MPENQTQAFTVSKVNILTVITDNFVTYYMLDDSYRISNYPEIFTEKLEYLTRTSHSSDLFSSVRGRILNA